MTHGNGNSTPTAHTRIENLLRKALAVAHFAAAAAVTPQASWTQPAWFIDPQNVTGLASDQNDGKTALKPVRTWNGGVVRKLDTYAPRLRQNTTITFLSGHTDNSDPVIFAPFIENGAFIVITGALPTPAAVGALGAVTAKNRAANAILAAATVPGGGTVGQMIVNTTRANSRAFVQRIAGGPSVQITQPFAPAVLPLGAVPVQNNLWNTGDAVEVFNLLRVNLTVIRPTMEDPAPIFTNNPLVITQLTAFDPLGFGASVLHVSTDVQFVEANVQRVVDLEATGLPFDAVPALGLFASNTAFSIGGINGGSPVFNSPTNAYAIFAGGCINGQMNLVSCQLDGDLIVGSAFGLGSLTNGAGGMIALDTSVTLSVQGIFDMRNTTPHYGGFILYGPGTINVQGASRLSYPSGAGAAVAAFPLTPRIEINGVTTANSVIVGAPDVLNGGIATTAANLDAAAGAAGFGGNAFQLGGGSIVNQSL